MKKNIFFFILGAVLFGGITGVVAYNYNAGQVSYSPKDTNWNVNNVEDAIKDLKIIKDSNGIVWENISSSFPEIIETSFDSATINYDFSDVKALRAIIYYAPIGIGGEERWGMASVTVEKKNTEYCNLSANNEQRCISFSDSNLTARRAGSSNNRMIISKIYATKTDLNIPMN